MRSQSGDNLRFPGDTARQNMTDEERAALRSVLEKVAAEDPDSLKAFLRGNPLFAEEYRRGEDCLRLLHRALAEKTKAGNDPEWAGLLVGLARRCPAGSASAVDIRSPSVREDAGILTDIARQLPPDQIMQLYRKIAPLVVFEILKLLTHSTSLEKVNEIADHLCNEETQERLRKSEHVRDGLLDELRFLLGDAVVDRVLTRERLLEVLHDCGAMNDLIAMENCIKLSRAKAG